MRIVLTGATGYIGSSVLAALVARGHDVIAPVRSAASAATATGAGATAVVGDITDASFLVPLLQNADAAIHLAASRAGDGPQFDGAVADAVISAFSGSGKPYVHTGGLWIHGPSDDLTEETPFAPPALVAWREGVESRLEAADLALSIVEPGIVYGHAAGIPASLADAPRDAEGRLTVVGDGTQHWATVHVHDVADLYALIVESPVPAGRMLALSGQNPTVAELGEAFAGGPVVPEGADASRARLGAAYADALMLDQQGRGAKARSLGWTPSRASLLEEIRAGHYAAARE
ncbi:MAG: NAD-dependent epimerase/dehydratase family protein [Microbacterium sp.]|uniref:NAD-dependent epimerase/dehydratase family protein n=1 Tax=Microbacterium sp. TaxID=51671 RepID=UPI001ACC5106|nr:NAD-dependent epimerase/dehydratase family protein [Microbacterium sp.]MBN9177385.1 NAD-dependent epimerase/dehydratase family protein [Microbacterium sp.]